jgi:VanZ family protein
MAVIFLLSAQPGLKVSSDASVDGPARDLAHIGAYALLAVLFVHALGRLGRPVTPAVAITAFALAVLYGITDEIHQSFVPDRTGTLVDIGWDALGAAIGVSAAWLVGRLRTLRPSSPPAPGSTPPGRPG